MINSTKVKKLTIACGMYRYARWVERNILKRSKLRTYKNGLVFYSNFIQQNDLVFDVGANIGEKTEIFLKLGARVIAFEPLSDCMQELKARCGNYTRLTTVEAALGSMTGCSTFYVRTYRNVSGLVRDWEGEVEQIIDVPVETLDKAIGKYGLPKFCKIDVEGYELEVLKGLSQPIPILSFEYHLEKGNINKAIDCIQYLHGLGDLKLNITPSENLIFAFQDWKRKDAFLEFFIDETGKSADCRYGDIYVKMKNR